ncbi:MAG: SMC family ATPase, partial [Anaerolineales bacterium]|nr:SMC family ATPase [Anaerolineales bacterium]
MNYDTFTNASFLLQGKADEFTTKTPNRRKEILADLLGVSQWDRYKETAVTRRREVESSQLLLDGQLQDIANELEEEDERRATLAAAKAELDAINEKRGVKEELLQQARQTAAAITQQKQMTQNLAKNLDRARRTLADLQQTLAQRQQERDSYAAILREGETIQANFAAWQQADETFRGWQEKADAYNKLQGAKRPFELTIAQERSRLQQRQRELEAQAGRVAAAEVERETVAAQQAAAQAQLAHLDTQLSELAATEAAWHTAQSELQQLESERKLLAQQAAQLKKQAGRVAKLRDEGTAVSANQQTAQEQLTAVAAQISLLGQQRTRHATALADKNSLEAEQERLREQMNRHKERIDRLSVETGGACPLCGQPLTDDHRRAVLADLQGEGEEMGSRFRNNRERVSALGVEITQLADSLKQAERLERDHKAQQQRLAQAEARLAEITQTTAEWEAGDAARLAELDTALADNGALAAQKKKAAGLATAVQAKPLREKERQSQQKQLSQAEARLAEIERMTQAWQTEGAAALAATQTQLANSDYAAEAQRELAALDEQIAAVGYDAAAHETARAAQNELAQAPARHQQWQQAQAAVKPLEDTLADLQQRASDQTETVGELAGQHETAVAQLNALTAQSGDLHAIEDEVFRLREEESIKLRTVGAAQQRLDVLDDLRQRREAINAQKAEIALHVQRLKLLEKACGRDGVQALLIEQALPDIEDRANELLERLTGGEMRVSFDTQRQLKSREATVETLDIHIQDGAGERPYENFSGGEQFRINFAIRLALSQVLAKRAGARLQTLVIDEGFGSQDPAGRQRLVEAINTIQDDFARILVITHVDELRDAFPARIEVSKATTGSKIAVSY